MKSMNRLPESELIVMMAVWRAGGIAGTGKITELLEKERGWSRSTTQVLLTRLEEKGFLNCTKKGRLKYYECIVTEEEYRRKMTKNMVEHFYQDSYKNLVAALVEDHALSEEDMKELAELIRRS